MIEHLFTADAMIALLTLTFLEIVLGIDNVIFISIVTGKLPEQQRKKATRVGLFLAMFNLRSLGSVLIMVGAERTLMDRHLSYWWGESFFSTSPLTRFTPR